jgi:hypothetical protein
VGPTTTSATRCVGLIIELNPPGGANAANHISSTWITTFPA